MPDKTPPDEEHGDALPESLDPGSLARLIDHTLLKPQATVDDVRALCAEGRAHGFAAVCVNPTWVSLCADELRECPTRVATVLPNGRTRGSNTPAIDRAGPTSFPPSTLSGFKTFFGSAFFLYFFSRFTRSRPSIVSFFEVKYRPVE